MELEGGWLLDEDKFYSESKVILVGLVRVSENDKIQDIVFTMVNTHIT